MIRVTAAITAALIWTALSVLPASAADKVVLMLNWYVYGEHAPFYYGKAKGIYAAEGIDLEIQEGRGSAATTQAVGDQPGAPWGQGKSAPLIALAHEIPYVATATIACSADSTRSMFPATPTRATC